MNAAFLVIDKPVGITSHDVVAAVRAVLGVEKVGHTGTLDPFATGVLPLALGGATRLIQFLDESLKVYDATIALGSCTDTGDPTGKTTREAPLPTASREEVEVVLQSFLGPRMQKPPAYSAVKKAGKPLYEYARKGEIVEVDARPITIHDLQLIEYDGKSLRVRLSCTRGTYARVLADEIATALGSAGHLSALQRPRSGPFMLEDSLSLDQLSKFAAPDSGKGFHEVLIARNRGPERISWHPREEVRDLVKTWLKRPLDVLSHLPLRDVTRGQADVLKRGGPIPPPPAGVPFGGKYAIVFGDELLAVAESTPKGPKTVRLG